MVLAMALSNVEGYSVGAPVSKPAATIFPFPDIEVSMFPKNTFGLDPSIEVPSVARRKSTKPFGVSRPSRSTYDLGLGKNAPVASTSKSPVEMERNNVIEAAQYWSEYESVREFPSKN